MKNPGYLYTQVFTVYEKTSYDKQNMIVRDKSRSDRFSYSKTGRMNFSYNTYYSYVYTETS